MKFKIKDRWTYKNLVKKNKVNEWNHNSISIHIKASQLGKWGCDICLHKLEVFFLLFASFFKMFSWLNWRGNTEPSRTHPVGRTVHCRVSLLSSPRCAQWILSMQWVLSPKWDCQAIPMTREGHGKHLGERRNHPGPFQLPYECTGTRKRKLMCFHLNSDNFLCKICFYFRSYANVYHNRAS